MHIHTHNYGNIVHIGWSPGYARNHMGKLTSHNNEKNSKQTSDALQNEKFLYGKIIVVKICVDIYEVNHCNVSIKKSEESEMEITGRRRSLIGEIIGKKVNWPYSLRIYL